MKVAYLVSQYPAPSHTFIAREIAALRRRGLDVVPCSVRAGVSLSEPDRREAERTFTILPRPIRAPGRADPEGLRTSISAALPAVVGLVAALAWNLRRPLRWLRALALSLRLHPPGMPGLAKSLAYFVEGMRLASELEARGVTHLHNHFANAASHAGMAAAEYLGIGWSLTLHGLGDWDGPSTVLLPEKVARTRFVACVSWYGRAQTMRLCPPEQWEKIHVVRCGVALEALPPRPQERGTTAGLRLLSVGRLSPEKGQIGLVEALHHAVRRGVDARLVIIGGGPEEGRIREAAASLGVTDRLELRGHQPAQEVLAALAGADVFLLSSFMEGLPVSIMEALAMQVPVVAPAITGIPELVIHQQTGLLFTAGRWDELGDCIAALGADPALRAALGARGRERVLAEFDADRAAEPLVALFSGADGRR